MTSAREMYEVGASYVFIPRVIGASYLVEIIERLQINGPGSVREEAKKLLKDRAEVIA